MSFYQEGASSSTFSNLSRLSKKDTSNEKMKISGTEEEQSDRSEGDWTEREGSFHMSASGWSFPARAETRGLPLARSSPFSTQGGVHIFLLRAHRN